MSGGTYNYASFKLQEFTDALSVATKDPRRVAFRELLILVTEAMHDIEWVDSGDYSEGDEYEAIDKVMGFLKADPNTISKAVSYDKLIEKLRPFVELEKK